MTTTFYATVDGRRITCHLHSLDEYESAEIGGLYTDAGSGGKWITLDDDEVQYDADHVATDATFELARRRGRQQFLAALSVEDAEDLLPSDLGMDDHDAWLDSVTGVWLIRDWPAAAPLEARMVGNTAEPADGDGDPATIDYPVGARKS